MTKRTEKILREAVKGLEAVPGEDLKTIDIHELDNITVDDRNWFAAHPGEDWRVRPLLEGEVPEGYGKARWIVVHQLEPGYRLRFPWDASDEEVRWRIDNGSFVLKGGRPIWVPTSHIV